MTESETRKQKRKKASFRYTEWSELQKAMNEGTASHMVEFCDTTEFYSFEDLIKEYDNLTSEEKKRFRIARQRKGFSTWYLAVIMKEKNDDGGH